MHFKKKKTTLELCYIFFLTMWSWRIRTTNFFIINTSLIQVAMLMRIYVDIGKLWKNFLIVNFYAIIGTNPYTNTQFLLKLVSFEKMLPWFLHHFSKFSIQYNVSESSLSKIGKVNMIIGCILDQELSGLNRRWTQKKSSWSKIDDIRVILLSMESSIKKKNWRSFSLIYDIWG